VFYARAKFSDNYEPSGDAQAFNGCRIDWDNYHSRQNSSNANCLHEGDIFAPLCPNGRRSRRRMSRRSFFPGFVQTEVRTSGATIPVFHKGDGPPVLLLHGYPETHVTWHKVAPRLAERFSPRPKLYCSTRKITTSRSAGGDPVNPSKNWQALRALVGSHHQSLLGHGSRHCHGIISTQKHSGSDDRFGSIGSYRGSRCHTFIHPELK